MRVTKLRVDHKQRGTLITSYSESRRGTPFRIRSVAVGKGVQDEKGSIPEVSETAIRDLFEL